ncbi:MAG: class I SAM-dependent methyltransferase [Bacteroidales bacterium]|nr:class I SAM-dependent methyltransferase [Bacteroidales bacterium]
MKMTTLTRKFFTLWLLSSAVLLAAAQSGNQTTEFKPQVGQEGKDVIWVPTPDELVNKMLEIAEVTSKDIVIDLGSGDGRTVIAAAKLGAKAIGIEFNPDMVALSIKKAVEAGVKDKATFLQTDLFEYDLSKATVITMFLLPDINLRLRPKLLNLKPGTRVVSNTFTMGDWEPDYEVTTNDESSSWYTALMWIVPAKIEGTWKLSTGELVIRQEFQMFYGDLKNDKKTSSLSEGRITGDTIKFRINGDQYTGKVTANKIEGTVTRNGNTSEWSATRVEN